MKLNSLKTYSSGHGRRAVNSIGAFDIRKLIGSILEIAVAVVLMVLCRDTFRVCCTSIDASLEAASVLVSIVAAGTINTATGSADTIIDSL